MARLLEFTDSNTSISGSTTAALATFTVPANVYRQLGSVLMQWTASANAGTRVPQLTYKDPTNTVQELVMVPTLAAAATGWYSLFEAAPLSAAFTSIGGIGYADYPLPGITMLPGWTLVPSDAAAIDAAGDLVQLIVFYNEFTKVII